jgi:hypothetical protein
VDLHDKYVETSECTHDATSIRVCSWQRINMVDDS